MTAFPFVSRATGSPACSDAAGNLKVKEVRVAEDERFVICFNPEAAERDPSSAPG